LSLKKVAAAHLNLHALLTYKFLIENSVLQTQRISKNNLTVIFQLN